VTDARDEPVDEGEVGATDILADVLDTAAEDLGGVTRIPVAAGAEYALGRVTFAEVAGDVCAFRLKPDIAAATMKTPGTRPSRRGPEWVEFHPGPEPDQYALDRLTSWFEMAFRLAARN
jgi:hypothetical protein